MKERTMEWRIVAFAKGKDVWYQAQYRVRWIWRWVRTSWAGDLYERCRYETPGEAEAAVLAVLDGHKPTYRGVLRAGTQRVQP